jgi:hypothetical protein
MTEPLRCPKCNFLYCWDGKKCCRKECRHGSGMKPIRKAKPRARVVGVYPVEADEPVHLIELTVKGDLEEFDFSEVTQENPNQPRSNWQVAYDEQVISEAEKSARVVFYFHYLDVTKPLLTPAGSLALPGPKRMPPRLKELRYEAP